MDTKQIEDMLKALQREKVQLESDLIDLNRRIVAYELVLNDLKAVTDVPTLSDALRHRPLKNIFYTDAKPQACLNHPELSMREAVRDIVQKHKRIHHKDIVRLLKAKGHRIDNPDSVRITCYQLGSEFEIDQGFAVYRPYQGEKPMKSN